MADWTSSRRSRASSRRLRLEAREVRRQQQLGETDVAVLGRDDDEVGLARVRRQEAVERVPEVALDGGHGGVGGRQVLLGEGLAVLAVDNTIVAAIEVFVSGKSSDSRSKPWTDS